jgi:amino acid transporter
MKLAAIGVAALVILLLYRRITVIGKTGVLLAVGTLFALLLTIAAGIKGFSWSRISDLPPGAFDLDSHFFFGLGDASRRAIYAFLGYYNVCFIGDEVKDPGRTIPRSILLAVVVVGLLYVVMNVTLLGAMSWREVMTSKYVAATVAARSFGPWAAACSGPAIDPPPILTLVDPEGYCFGRRRGQRSPWTRPRHVRFPPMPTRSFPPARAMRLRCRPRPSCPS